MKEKSVLITSVFGQGYSCSITAEKPTSEYHPRPGNDPIEDQDGDFTTATAMYFSAMYFEGNSNEEITVLHL